MLSQSVQSTRHHIVTVDTSRYYKSKHVITPPQSASTSSATARSTLLPLWKRIIKPINVVTASTPLPAPPPPHLRTPFFSFFLLRDTLYCQYRQTESCQTSPFGPVRHNTVWIKKWTYDFWAVRKSAHARACRFLAPLRKATDWSNSSPCGVAVAQRRVIRIQPLSSLAL